MTFEMWLAFTAAAALLLAIPGPTIILVVSYGLSQGRSAALSTVAGVALGDLVAMCLSFAGLGAVLAASAELFAIVKWAGALYLIYLGIKMWRTAPTAEGPRPDRDPRSKLAIARHAFTVTVLNPKSIGFFVAFLPQFMNSAAPMLPQMALLGGTFLFLASTSVCIYGFVAGSARATLPSPGRLKLFNRAGGSLLIGAGLFTAATGRAS
jgi:threonine/homoserine/homoserine lactone efflux protein